VAVRIRLQRFGKKKKPFYRLVVAESSTPRNGKAVETIGTYDPQKESDSVVVKEERVKYWLSVGATPTRRVEHILGSLSLLEATKYTSANQKVSKKQLKEQSIED